MAELVDALGSGPSGGNTVEVRVLFWAPVYKSARASGPFYFRTQILFRGVNPRTKAKTQCTSDTAYLALSMPLTAYSNGWRSTMVSSRSGPVETMSTGTPHTLAMRSRPGAMVSMIQSH